MNITVKYKPQPLWSYFKLPRWEDTVTPDYKKLRLFVGDRYGKITLGTSLIAVIVIPYWQSPILPSILKLFKHHHHQHDLTQQKSKTLFHRLFRHSQIFKIIIFWLIFSLTLTYVDTYNDLLFITKRLGRVSAACVPSLLLITLRPSPLPKTLFLSLLPLHKWLSRIVVLESIIHSVLYIVYYHRNNTLKKLWKWVNIDGFIALGAFILIAITSLPKVRRSAFKIFYITHYTMTWISVIALHFHARPGIGLYTILNFFILGYQIFYRITHTVKAKVSVSSISPSLAILEFPADSVVKKPIFPGAHVRINNKSGWLKDGFFKLIPLAHPFTIASLPNEKIVKLIVRRGNFPLKTNSDYYVTGSFEPDLPFMKKASFIQRFLGPRINKPGRLLGDNSPLKYDIEAKRVLIVVGGSGVSFGIPLLRILNYNGITARLIWVCKDIHDLNLLNSFRGIQGIECYITGDMKEDDIFIDYFEDSMHTDNNVQKVNYGSIDEEPDEIDFTTIGEPYKKAHGVTSLNTSKNNVKLYKDHEDVNIDICGTCEYRGSNVGDSTENVVSPSAIDAETFKSIKIPKSINIFYGRPNLNSEHYEWCLQSQCIGPTFTQNGQTVCCRDVDRHQDVEKSNIWVVAAGPTGLVEHAKQWAVDGGLRCHVESFAV